MQSISVFEIIKVGIGPSSSHTMGPWNAAEMFLNEIYNRYSIEDVTEVFVEFYGSLAKTGIGHGTDIAAMMGLSGENFKKINTDTIAEKVALILDTETILLGGEKELPFVYGKNLVLNMKVALDYHPNGMLFKAIFKNGRTFEKEYYSVGGGFVSTLDDSFEGNYSIRTLYPCHKGEDILRYCEQLNISRVSDLVLLNEEAWRTKQKTKEKALTIWEQIKESVFRGVKKEGVLPGGLNVVRRASSFNKSLLGNTDYENIEEWMNAVATCGHDFNCVSKWISCFALAVNEENASFGRIVTAPTNGASGVIPAVLLYAKSFTKYNTNDDIIRFLLVAGEIGTLFKKNATISAAMGGCQAEIGVSSAMAAAGLTEICGGTPGQVLMAAEIAMEHHLGLTCDPINGLVQIPCIERNSMGAMKAITASNIALESDPSNARVTLDEVTQSMWETALHMHQKYKETSEGGLAVSVNVPEC